MILMTISTLCIYINILCTFPEISLEFYVDIGVGVIWEELLTTSNLLFHLLKRSKESAC